jgi:hypothetical protein
MRHRNSLLRCERGSFTVEASLVLPIILLLSVLLLFVPLFFYMQVDVQRWTVDTVERTAGQWTHRADALIRGETGWQRPDGLYWRWKQMLEGGAELDVPVPQLIRGEIKLVREGLFAAIVGSFRSDFHFPEFWRQSPSEVQGNADAVITDPVEWLRTVDLVRVYGAELQRRSIRKAEADAAMQRFFSLQAPDSFATHDQAAAYLRTLVGGYVSSRPTPYGLRIMDAMTPEGTLHQAYLTFRTSGLREQMLKDAHLIREGDPVQAVVWHFFRRTGDTGKVGPSDAFINELKSYGISVVIHD